MLVVCLLSMFFTSYCVCPCADPNLCKPLTVAPRKELFVFGGRDYTFYDWNHLTTIVDYFGIPSLICVAHSKGVRVISPTPPFGTQNLHNKTFMNVWLENSVSLVKEKFYDGINFDFEDEIDETDVLSSRLLTEVTRQLSLRLYSEIPGIQISFDVGWNPNVDKRFYEYSKISEIVDFLVLMDYDEQSAIYGACKAGPTSSLPNLDTGIENFKKLGINSQKLVAALPWYGRDFTCINKINETVCPIPLAPWRGVPCTDANAPEYSYSDIITKYVPISKTGIRWDVASSSPYLNYEDKKGVSHQIWFDNAESISKKIQWVKNLGLRGVGVFTADDLDTSNTTQKAEMWESLNLFFKK